MSRAAHLVAFGYDLQNAVYVMQLESRDLIHYSLSSYSALRVASEGCLLPGKVYGIIRAATVNAEQPG